MNVLSKLNPEVITDLILPHLDGKSLIILSVVSPQFHELIWKINKNSDIWRNICTSTWPSLHPRQDFLSTISLFPGGYRSFFLDAFPSIHPPLINNPVPRVIPHKIFLVYAVDIFLHGEQKPFYSLLSRQTVNMFAYPHGIFRFNLYDEEGKMNFIKVTRERERCFHYLLEKLRLSCVAIDPNGIKHAVSLIPGGSPVKVRESLDNGQVFALFEWYLLVPGQLPYPDMEYTMFVTCRVEVGFNREGDGEDLSVNFIDFTMVDAAGKAMLERHGAPIILHAIQNGERRGRRTALTRRHGDSDWERLLASLENLVPRNEDDSDSEDEEDPDPFTFE